jgi:hypothetical protein
VFYRVVMQGRTLGGADLEEVKGKFVRVTGLPAGAAENLFGGMPQVVRRQLSQADAERIAATLRAIGVAATVERELLDGESADGIEVVRPFNAGPPTVVPGDATSAGDAAAAARPSRLPGVLRAKAPLLLGGILLVAAAIALAPFVDDLVTDLRRTSAPASAPAAAAPQRPPAPEVVDATPAMNSAFLHGPWRCTDQRTGVSAFWSYVPDGALIFHGDVLSDRPPPPAIAATAPNGWTLDGARLFHTFPNAVPNMYTVSELTLSRLNYGDGRDVEVQCRRP